MRTKPFNYRRPDTITRFNQESKFRQIVNITTPLLRFIRLGFSRYPGKAAAYHKSISFNMLNCFSTDPDYFNLLIDSFAIAAGDLTPPEQFTAAVQVDSTISISRTITEPPAPASLIDFNFVFIFDSLTASIFEPETLPTRGTTATSIIVCTQSNPANLYLFQYCALPDLSIISDSVCVNVSDLLP